MHMEVPEPTPDVVLPLHLQTTFVLVRPHYPENVGAAARAIKTMGFTRLALVKPGRLASPGHEMALKMAVKSRDVLLAAPVYERIEQALEAADFMVATTSRRGVSGVLSPRSLAPLVLERAGRGERIAIVFGNEKTGLAAEYVEAAHARVRIPMAANQPSVNLAQATQVIAYELFASALSG
jgi:TrmH family RNA methyltransferase